MSDKCRILIEIDEILFLVNRLSNQQDFFSHNEIAFFNISLHYGKDGFVFYETCFVELNNKVID